MIDDLRRALDELSSARAALDRAEDLLRDMEAAPPSRPGVEPWLTKRQAATHLGRSTRWVELQAAEAGLPYAAVGGRNLYRASQLDAWVRERDRLGAD